MSWLALVRAVFSAQEALQPLPAEPPIGGPLWTVVIPALLLGLATVATWMLYQAFSGD